MPECEAVGRDNNGVGFSIDKASLAKGFGIHNRRIDIGENLELVGHARVIAVAGNAVADYPFTALLLYKRLDHAVFQRHPANPAIRHNGHRRAPSSSVLVLPRRYEIARGIENLFWSD